MPRTSASTDVLILGGGVSGSFLASLLSPKRKVLLVEKEEKEPRLLKRIKVSGNGRCNFFNEDLLDPESRFFGSDILHRFFHPQGRNYPKEVLDHLVGKLGIAYFQEGKLFYPFFNRSECVLEPLKKAFEDSKAAVLFGEALVIDRKEKTCLLKTEEGEKTISYKDIVIALGGESYDRKPFSGKLLSSFGVKRNSFFPCLCPIRVKERIPNYLSGNRLRGKLTLWRQDKEGRKEIASEEGEVLFKSDGLSGIALFNLTLPLLADRRKKEGEYVFSLDYSWHDGFSGEAILSQSLPLFLRRYLDETGRKLFEPLVFSFRELYPFQSSQVSFGGLSLDAFDENFTLRDDDSFHAIGEILDVAFPCGGYNIGFALTSAYVLSQYLRR